MGGKPKTPIKLHQIENENELKIEMILHAKRYTLTLNKEKCVGCGVCMEICPKEAIQVTRTPKQEGEKAKPPTVNISKEKCHFCGMCEAICPFGALNIEIDGKSVIPVIKTESFPQLVREIKINENKCGIDCLEIEEVCPLDNIALSVLGPDGKKITNVNSISKKKLKVRIEVDKDSCPCCRICETKFPEGAISVEKIFYGSIRINNEKCPESCHDCVDVCPIPGVLFVSNDGKVQVNDSHCVYCGTCKITCPEEDALEIKRTRISHTEIHSGAWNMALEKLASTSALTKELENKNAVRLKKAIMKRIPMEDLDSSV